jgi:hypothetical protein
MDRSKITTHLISAALFLSWVRNKPYSRIGQWRYTLVKNLTEESQSMDDDIKVTSSSNIKGLWCSDVTSTHVLTTNSYDPNITTSEGYDLKMLRPNDIMYAVRNDPRLDIHGCLVTCNTTSHQCDLGCDITSKFPLSESRSKCHESLGSPVCQTQQKSANPWVSVPFALT